ncbi:hypothetical protein HY029_05740 [Candidatus Gottesmanbacteria bacterium]|nr:hypothetical protein [Candidatus Gottesmanbacteria bacterium]
MNHPPTQSDITQGSQPQETTEDQIDKLVKEMDEGNPENTRQAVFAGVAGLYGIFDYQNRKNNARDFFNQEIDIHKFFDPENPEYFEQAMDATLLARRPSILGIKVNENDLLNVTEAIKEVKATHKEIGDFRNEKNTIYIRSLQRLNNLSAEEMAEVIINAKNSLGEGRPIEETLRLETLRKTRFKVDKLIEEIKIEAVRNHEVLTESELNNRLQAKLNGETIKTLEIKGKELVEKHQEEIKEREKQIVQKGKQKVAEALGVELKPEVQLQPQIITPTKTSQVPTSPPVSVPQFFSNIRQNITSSFNTSVWQPISSFGSKMPSFKTGSGAGDFFSGLKNGLLDFANLFKIGANKGLSSGLASKALTGALGLASGGIGIALAGLASTLLSNAKIFLFILVVPFILFFLLLIGPSNPFSSYTSQSSYQASLPNNKLYVWKQFEKNYLSLKKTINLSKVDNKSISNWNQFEYLTLNTNRHDDMKK